MLPGMSLEVDSIPIALATLHGNLYDTVDLNSYVDLIEIYRKIDRIAECVLDAIFENMWDFEFVPIHAITRHCGMNESKAESILRRLASLKLVENKYTEYVGACFTFKGLSVYSLRRLVRRNVVDMLGKLMGEGKESVVFNCFSERYGEVVLKFHRIGYQFRKVKEKRDYGSLHYTVLTVRSAKREFTALKKLYGAVSVPKPIAWEGNAVVMELIDARELYKVKLRNPKEILEMIIDEVKKMFERGIVHGDLSQFNILISENGIWIIDFPQSVDADSELADEYLQRDVKNILLYFEKSYGIRKDLNEVLRYIKGET